METHDENLQRLESSLETGDATGADSLLDDLLPEESALG